MTHRWGMSLLLAVISVSQRVEAQQTTARLEGIVRDDFSRAPLSDVTVTLLDPGLKSISTAITDARGFYSFPTVAAGQYRLRAEKDRYLPKYYGEPVSSLGTVVSAQPGQTIAVAFSLVRAGSITGRVLAPDGTPLHNAQVELLTERFGMNQEKLLSPVPGFKPVRTGEGGEYKIPTLSPGVYYVKASYSGAGSERMAATYYPSGQSPLQAISLQLKPEGTNTYNIDVRLIEASVFSISGRIVLPEQLRDSAQEISSTLLYLLPAKTGFNPVMEYPSPLADRAAALDRFTVAGVLPGTYELVIGLELGSQRNKPIYVGRVPVQVTDENIEDVLVTVDPGVPLEGRFVMTGGAVATPDWSRFQLMIESLDGLPARLAPTATVDRSFVQSDGSFRLPYLPRGRYFVSVAGPQGSYLENAWLGPKNILGQSLEVDSGTQGPLRLEMNNNGGRVNVGVLDDAKAPVAAATVILVPSLQFRNDMSAYKTAVTDPQGNAILSGIRPGTYQVFAFARVEYNAWLNSEYMSQYAATGETVVVTAGQQSQLSVKMSRGRQ